MDAGGGGEVERKGEEEKKEKKEGGGGGEGALQRSDFGAQKWPCRIKGVHTIDRLAGLSSAQSIAILQPMTSFSVYGSYLSF